MKNRTLILLLLLANASLIFAQFSLPSDTPKPTATVTRFALETLTLRDVTFAIEVTVKNPYPVNLSIGALGLEFGVEGQNVFKTQTKSGFTVPSNNQKANTFLVTLAYEGIMKLVKTYAQKDWLNTTIKGTLSIPLPKLPALPPQITFTYNLEKKIPALKPVVSIRNFTVKGPDTAAITKALTATTIKVDPAQAADYFGAIISGKKPAKEVIAPSALDVPFGVSFTLALQNTAKAPLSFGSLEYQLLVDGVELLKGKSTQVKVEGTTTLVTIETSFSSKQLGPVIQKTFAARKGSFQIIGQAKVTVPKEIRDTPIPLSFDEKGSFSF